MPATAPSSRARPTARTIKVIATAIVLAMLASGCGAAEHPPPITQRALEEAQTFPYYTTYWVGRTFAGAPLAAADGTTGYNSLIGDSVYYGDCASGTGALSGECLLPLQVTTVIYRLHSNKGLGAQRNAVIRGVPAAVYDGGRSLELYTGRVAIDIFSDTFAHALAAAEELRPLNAPGNARGPLPAPVFCPNLYGPQSLHLAEVMAALPRHACLRAAATLALRESERIP